MKRFLLILSILSLIVACQKAPELTVTSPSSIELGVDGSSSTITFTANRDWSVRSSDSWVSVSPSSGTASDEVVTVRVSCSANTTYDDRTATITITMEELTQTVSVKQPANLGIVLPTQSYNLASDARTIDVEVRSNVQYAVSVSDSWIKQTGTKGLVTDKLTFSVEENDTYDGRSATITIKPQNATVQEQVISVKQAQKDALIVKDTSFDMPYGGGEIEVKVEANVSFDVKPSEEWIHYVETKALSGSTVRLTVDENPTYSVREGKIEIKQKNGILSHTVTVNQKGWIAAESISLDKSEVKMVVGENVKLVATILPESTTDKTIVWSSSNSSIVSVSNEGKLYAYNPGEVTITAMTALGDKSASCRVFVDYYYFGDPIDLGLSVKWSSLNLGAQSPEEGGYSFAWGEIEPRSKIGENEWESYKWANDSKYTITKYCTLGGYGSVDNKIVLDPEDDAATVNLGDGWRLPTDKEFAELFNNCTWKRFTNESTYGYYEITSKINQNMIILPAAFYWSKMIANNYPYLALGLQCRYGEIYYNHSDSRCALNPIRPVYEE